MPWRDNLPEGVKEWDEVKNSDSPEKFWDQMTNMRSRMGSSIRIPGEDAGEEDRAAFHKRLQEKVPGLMPTPNFDDETTLSELYAKMGRPEKKEDYKVPEFKNSKGEKVEGIGKEFVEFYKDLAFKAGMSQKKFEETLTALIGKSITEGENAQHARSQDMEALSKEWGAALDRNISTVTTFLAQSDAPKAVIDAVKGGNADSTTMKWLYNLATKTVGKPGSFQDDNSSSGAMTPGEAAIKISEIRNNKQHPYNNKLDPGHEAAKRYMRELYLLKDPKNGKSAAPATSFDVGGLS